MTVRQRIHDKLVEAFSPERLEVIDESHMHNVPEGAESHFKVIVVAEAFEGVGRLDRQRRINALLADELAGPVHALSMRAWTPAQWRERGGEVPESPPCMGGG